MFRQAKRRRLTLDNLTSSVSDGDSIKKCDMVAQSPSEMAVVVATPSSLSSSSSSSSSTTAVPPAPKHVSIDTQRNDTNETSKVLNSTDTVMIEKQRYSNDSNDVDLINQRLSTVSMAESKSGSQRGSYVESDESDEGERENNPPGGRLSENPPSTRKRAESVHDQNKNLSVDLPESSLRHHRNSWVTQSDRGGNSSDVLRKRMYRIGLNLFNTKPEKGLTFLIRQGFVEDSPNVISNFLVSRKGISRQVIGEFLGNGTDRSKKILKAVCNQIDLSKLDIDEALRKFQSHIRIQV